MSTMKKLLIALPFVAGASWAGTSHYAGSQTQTGYQDLLSQLNELSLLRFENESYTSGLGNSQAITQVYLIGVEDADVLFRLHHEIKHSPLRMGDDGVQIGAVSIETTLHDKAGLPEELQAMFASDEPFRLVTDVGYSGSIHNQLNVSGIDIEESGNTFGWMGMNLESTTIDGNTIGSGDIGKLVFTDQTGEIVVAGGDIDMDVQYHGDAIYTGEAGIGFADINVTNPMLPAPVKLGNFSARSITDLEGNNMNSSVKLAMAGIDSPLPINDASLDVNIDALSVEGLRTYDEFMRKYSGDSIAMLENNPEAVAEILTSMRDVVQAGSSLGYDLQMSNDDGKVAADITLGLKAADAPGMSADALDNIVTGRDLLNVLELNGELDADTAALQQTPLLMMAAQFEDYLKISDNKISSKLSLDGTVLTINELDLPLDMMTGGMLDIPLADLMKM